MIVKVNDDSKLLRFRVILGGGRGSCVFYLCAWSSSLPCLILGVLYVKMEVFPPIFKMEKSKRNDIVELWKFSIKMGGC